MAAADSVDPVRWQAEFESAVGRISGRFARREPLTHARDLVAGLVAGLERKNCWTIAEHAGHASPHGLQHLLGRAAWDADGARDDVRGYVLDRLGDPNAVLVLDETGDLKKGTATVGVQRQYTGTAGRIENAQVAVYLTYAAPGGHAFIDRALYLPKSWCEDPDRCARAGVPDDIRFATKPQLAGVMIDRAVAAGTPAAWVAGDEVYGADAKLRAKIRGHQLGYVMQVAASRQVTTKIGNLAVRDLAAQMPATAWQTYSAGEGSKGPRYYSWALISIEPEPEPDDGNCAQAGEQMLLVRRNDTTGELAYHLCFAPKPVPMRTLVRVAGQHWRIEENFQAAKGHVGLDQHQVRRWDSWHRWTTLAMLAHAFLTVLAVIARSDTVHRPGLIAITVAEARRLFNTLTRVAARNIGDVLAWSSWRRRHQARARTSHYHRRITAGQRHDLRL
ncbi:IS701 family transposase [Isoptericola sp. BMS4]|uniref:IS701 family transposase n=1 Tax=Isoptericola sp. BMS4 TaxID=2527875 RepID=UPI00141E38AC|nr:IS701 family transposase [Isoptericola sp. BMS4]